MRGLEAAPPAFSPLNSEFNPFLFAPIGEERNDTVLTVLSALARLGIDPWQESARLAQLSTKVATQKLTSIISGLPNGRWAQSDAGAIAARLIELLPAKRAAQIPSRLVAYGGRPQASPMMILLLLALLAGLTFFTIALRMRSATDTDSSTATTSSPSPPAAGSE